MLILGLPNRRFAERLALAWFRTNRRYSIAFRNYPIRMYALVISDCWFLDVSTERGHDWSAPGLELPEGNSEVLSIYIRWAWSDELQNDELRWWWRKPPFRETIDKSNQPVPRQREIGLLWYSTLQVREESMRNRTMLMQESGIILFYSLQMYWLSQFCYLEQCILFAEWIIYKLFSSIREYSPSLILLHSCLFSTLFFSIPPELFKLKIAI